MLLLPLLAAAVVPSVAAFTRCHTCATPGLRNNWLMTGIEKPPAGLQFMDKCASPPDVTVPITQCDSLICLEMAIPTADPDHWEFLRGCYAELIKENTAQLTPETVTGTGVCYKYDFDTGRTNIVNYCKGEENAEGNDTPNPCNERAKLTAATPPKLLVPATGAGGHECTAKTGIDCVSCTRTDTMGTCDSSTKGSVKGPLCVKIRGMVNGREFEERGPSFIPPFAETSWDKCGIPSTLNSTTYLGPAFGTSAGQSASARRKRSLKQLFGGTKCYCKTGMCNGSPIMGGLPATIVLVLSAVPFFL